MRAYQRFLRYVTVHTTANGNCPDCPSSPGQWILAGQLVEELKALGVADARVDEFCCVYGSIPATPGYEGKPAIGFIAHLDTAEEAPGENVKPILHPDYDGCNLMLSGGTVLNVEKYPFLKNMKGETLITSDGTTLLGADDKAGAAEIMTAVEQILASDIPHGKVCVAFTPDEEIGRGMDHFDIPTFGADFAYTVDGGDVCSIEYENFNAASATVEIKGFSVHPGESKDRMINASNVAWEFHGALPAMDRPEHTQDREGFYHLTGVQSDVTSAKLSYSLRDHDSDKMEYKKQTMQHIADRLNDKYGAGTVIVQIQDWYFNMIEKIKPHMHLIHTAEEAVCMVGLTPETVPIRGGTDGTTLSFMGLPCPNLGTGGYNFHGTAECITAERMDKACQILQNIIYLYAK